MMRAAPAACGDSTTSCSSSDVGATPCASSDASAASTSALGERAAAARAAGGGGARDRRMPAAARAAVEGRPGESLAGLLDPAAAAPAPARGGGRAARGAAGVRGAVGGAQRPCSSTICRSPRRRRATRPSVARRRRRRGLERGGVPHRRAAGRQARVDVRTYAQSRWLMCVRVLCVYAISLTMTSSRARAHMHASHTHCPFRMSLSRKSGMPPAVLAAAPSGRLGSGSAGSSGRGRVPPASSSGGAAAAADAGGGHGRRPGHGGPSVRGRSHPKRCVRGGCAHPLQVVQQRKHGGDREELEHPRVADHVPLRDPVVQQDHRADVLHAGLPRVRRRRRRGRGHEDEAPERGRRGRGVHIFLPRACSGCHNETRARCRRAASRREAAWIIFQILIGYSPKETRGVAPGVAQRIYSDSSDSSSSLPAAAPTPKALSTSSMIRPSSVRPLIFSISSAGSAEMVSKIDPPSPQPRASAAASPSSHIHTLERASFDCVGARSAIAGANPVDERASGEMLRLHAFEGWEAMRACGDCQQRGEDEQAQRHR